MADSTIAAADTIEATAGSLAIVDIVHTLDAMSLQKVSYVSEIKLLCSTRDVLCHK